MALSRNEQLKGMSEGDALCRVLVGNHVPAQGYPVVDRTRDGGYRQWFVCDNCGAEVSRYRDRHGFLTGRRGYKYEPGYLLQEGGQMTKSERASVFLQHASAHTGSVTKLRRSRRAAS